MDDRSGIFAGDDPFALARDWLAEAEKGEPNDPNAIALATVDESGVPNVRMVLLKEIEAEAFVFYTNYTSKKAKELDGNPHAAFVIHWKSIRRQIRVRGTISKEDGPQADAYFKSRSPNSRLGAWASEQSTPLASRSELVERLELVTAEQGADPQRPPFWGGFRLRPQEIEFWADGEHRLHDRFKWTAKDGGWTIDRLSP